MNRGGSDSWSPNSDRRFSARRAFPSSSIALTRVARKRNDRLRRRGAARISEKRPDRGPGSAWCDDQPGVLALADGEELVVSSALHDPAAGKDDDLVAVADRREPVGDDQAGATAPAQVVVDDHLGLRVERACGLVEDQEAGVADQGPGDLQPLALAAGEIPPLLADDRAISSPPLEQVAVDRRVDARLDQPVRGNRLVPERQILANRALEETDVCVDQLDRVDKDLARELARGLAVVEDFAAPWLVEPGGEAADRRFSASRAAHQGDALARAGDEREILDQRFVDRPVVAESDLPKFDVAAQPARWSATDARLDQSCWTASEPSASMLKTVSIGRLRTSSMRSRSARSSWTSVPSRARSRNGWLK